MPYALRTFISSGDWLKIPCLFSSVLSLPNIRLFLSNVLREVLRDFHVAFIKLTNMLRRPILICIPSKRRYLSWLLVMQTETHDWMFKHQRLTPTLGTPTVPSYHKYKSQTTLGDVFMRPTHRFCSSEMSSGDGTRSILKPGSRFNVWLWNLARELWISDWKISITGSVDLLENGLGRQILEPSH